MERNPSGNSIGEQLSLDLSDSKPAEPAASTQPAQAEMGEPQAVRKSTTHSFDVPAPPRRRRKKRSKRRKLKQLASATIPLLLLLTLAALAAGVVRVVEDVTRPRPAARPQNQGQVQTAGQGQNRFRLAPPGMQKRQRQRARQARAQRRHEQAARPAAADPAATQVDILDWDLGETAPKSKQQNARIDIEAFELPDEEAFVSEELLGAGGAGR